MIKKILITTLITIFYSIHAFSAGGDGDGGSSKVKTNYEKAVSHIKSAKKYEKKGKIEKAKKKYDINYLADKYILAYKKLLDFNKIWDESIYITNKKYRYLISSARAFEEGMKEVVK